MPAAVAGQPGVVGDQPDLLPLQRLVFAFDQDVDPAPHRTHRRLGRRQGRLDDRLGDDRGDLRAQPARRRPLAVGVQAAGQDDDRGIGLRIDPEARPGEPGVAERSRPEAVAALNELAKEFRRELSRTMKLRRVPELRFRYDDSVDRGERIETLLRGGS